MWTFFCVQFYVSLFIAKHALLFLALFYRQGYPEDYNRANRSAYNDYYADYAKHYDYGGMSHASQTVSSISQYTLTFLFTQVLFFFFFNFNFSLKDTTTASMTHDTGDTMITPTGPIMMTATEAETTTIINTCTLLGMQRKYYVCRTVTVTGIFGDGYNFIMAYICSCSFAKCGAV